MERREDDNLALFDALLKVLANHEADASLSDAIQALKSARFNYTQRDTAHLINNLCLAWSKLMDVSAADVLSDDLKKEVRARAQSILTAATEFRHLAEEHEAKGGKLLSHDEILAEVAERRGGSR